MNDLEQAKNVLIEKNLAICIVKNGVVIYESRERGIFPLYKAVLTMKHQLHKASMADRVIGKAAAMLCNDAGIHAVYAKLIAESAIAELKEMELVYDKSVPYIMNRSKDGMCPMEKLSREVETCEELMEGILVFLKKIGRIADE